MIRSLSKRCECGARLQFKNKIFESTSEKLQDEEGLEIHTIQIMCDKCGLIQVLYPMSERSLEYFYKADENGLSPYRKKYPLHQDELDQHTMQMFKFIRRSAEKGCMENPKIFLNIGGGDPSQTKQLSLLTHSKGFDYDTGFTRGYAPNEAYDTIMCLDVVEHVRSPLTFLTNILAFEHCQQLFICVPDVFTTQANMSNDVWFSRAHLYHFSFDTLKYYCDLAGWELAYHEKLVTEKGRAKLCFALVRADLVDLNDVKKVVPKVQDVIRFLESRELVYKHSKKLGNTHF